MTAGQRLDLLAPVLREIPELGRPSHSALQRWLQAELGSVDALERWQTYGGHQARPLPPHHLYLVGANNLEVSSYQVILAAFVLGCRLTLKLPQRYHREILRFLQKFPAPLRRLIQTESTLNPHTLQRADVVIVLGRDETIAHLRTLIRPAQRLVGYGHKVSLIALSQFPTSALARKIALDISLYDQSGCLSPQAVCFAPKMSGKKLGDVLAPALAYWNKKLSFPSRALMDQARVQEARDFARARGRKLWTSPHSTAWTIILEPDPHLTLPGGSRVIYLRPLSSRLLTHLGQTLRGQISTVGFDPLAAGSSHLETFRQWGASRFCPVGKMQFPPLTWHHDGRPTLGDLVTWSDLEFNL